MSDACPQFAQVLFSLTAFIIFPFACCHVRVLSARLYTAVVASLAALTSLLLWQLRWQWTAACIAAHSSLLFLCPLCLLSIHKFKVTINGPWDEAVPRLAQACESLSSQTSLPAASLM